MKIVALTSFFGTTGNTRKGDVLDVADKLANAWVKAGIARKANADDATPAKATISTSAPQAPVEPTDTTSEVVDTKTDEPTGDQPDVEADKEPVTGTDNKPNAKKESK